MTSYLLMQFLTTFHEQKYHDSSVKEKHENYDESAVMKITVQYHRLHSSKE